MTALIAEARSWIGTPYVHRAAVKGGGCDCLGLICGLWQHLHGHLPQAIPTYSQDWAEVRRDEALWSALQSHLHDVSDQPIGPAQIALFRMREGAVAKHLGLIATTGAAPTFIHAYARHGVVESPLSAPWARRIAARFKF